MNRVLPAILLLAVLWALPDSAFLQSPPDPCTVIPSLPCNGGGSRGLGNIIMNMVFSSGAKNTFGTFLALYFFVYGMRLIILGERSDVVQETKMAYAYGVTGCAMYIFAENIIMSVGSQNGANINTAPIGTALYVVIGYINAVIGTLLMLIITYQAIRIILKRGDDGEMEKARKRFVFIVTGVFVYVLANAIVMWSMPGTGTSKLITEIIGIIRFILEIIGVLSVLSFIFAGFLYVISVNEGTTDRAKKAMKNTAIALIVVLFAYVIVRFAANGLRF